MSVAGKSEAVPMGEKILALHREILFPLAEMSSVSSLAWGALTDAVRNTFSQQQVKAEKKPCEGGSNRIQSTSLVFAATGPARASLREIAGAISKNKATLAKIVGALEELIEEATPAAACHLSGTCRRPQEDKLRSLRKFYHALLCAHSSATASLVRRAKVKRLKTKSGNGSSQSKKK